VPVVADRREDVSADACITKQSQGLGFFEKYLSVWVLACIGAGIALGKLAPGVAHVLDGLVLEVGGAPIVSIPIAVCLFFMMYPIMVKIDFAEVVKASTNVKPVLLTLCVNWLIKPFTMYAICLFFLGTLFHTLIGPDAVDFVKLPLGLDLDIGATHGEGTVVLVDGTKMLEVPLWRSYLAGCILLGIAPCTAMVLVWGFLARGNDGHTLVMVAINSLTMLALYGLLGGFLLGVGRHPVPWQATSMGDCRKGGGVVQRQIPPPPDTRHDQCASRDARAPFLLQRGGHPLESADDRVDRNSTERADAPHLCSDLWACASPEALLP
jgi:ACR3 family arsenite transporter